VRHEERKDMLRQRYRLIASFKIFEQVYFDNQVVVRAVLKKEQFQKNVSLL
jgi:hypothetical protein